MARRRRGRKSHLQPVDSAPSRTEPQDDSGEDGLIQQLRSAIKSDDPVDLLIMVSALLDATDPRNRDPLAREKPTTTREQLLESFMGARLAETTAVLTVMRALVDDELTQARITRELARRRHELPPWLEGLEDAVGEWEMYLLAHILKDGDDYFLGVGLPTEHSISASVSVDTNLGTVVKDAFVVGEPLEDLVDKASGLLSDPAMLLTPIGAADGRAEVEQAIARGAGYWRPLQSDTWPMCRPLVEWMLRLLPDGGRAEGFFEWTDEQVAAIADDFFASPFGRPLDREDERSLMGGILWFGTSYTGGDPYRWSNVRVEVLLQDWFPRTIVGPTEYLAKMPDVLRAFVRFCHDRQGIRADLTEDALDAISRHEASYRRLIRSEPARGMADAIADAVRGGVDGVTLEEIVLSGLADEVGGRMRLQSLDVAPLPDEPFDWEGIPADVHPVVQDMLEACDGFADGVGNTEYRTAMRRFLSRAAAGDPAIFRRRGSRVRGAAAVAWAISEANQLYSAKYIQESFGLRSGVSQRAEPMLRAIGIDSFESGCGPPALGSPDLLLSSRREEIVERRDSALAGFGLGPFE
jgi:hypothetical protein